MCPDGRRYAHLSAFSCPFSVDGPHLRWSCASALYNVTASMPMPVIQSIQPYTSECQTLAKTSTVFTQLIFGVAKEANSYSACLGPPLEAFRDASTTSGFGVSPQDAARIFPPETKQLSDIATSSSQRARR